MVMVVDQSYQIPHPPYKPWSGSSILICDIIMFQFPICSVYSSLLNKAVAVSIPHRLFFFFPVPLAFPLYVGFAFYFDFRWLRFWVSHVGFGGFVGLGCFWGRFGCLTGASSVFWVLGFMWVLGVVCAWVCKVVFAVFGFWVCKSSIVYCLCT
jgi:hypothetical protein